MLGDPYAYDFELQQRVGGEDDPRFSELVDVASRAVERFTRRQFNKTTSASPRRFRAVDCQRLPVDDFHTVTGLAISVDGTAWNVADVDPRPWNGVVDGQSGWPFFDLMAITKSWPSSRRATVTVTAQWGWSVVPEAIRQATLDVAQVMFEMGGTPSVASESVAGYSVSYRMASGGDYEVPPGMAKACPYRRKRFGMA